tara:strand:+ start:20669 stop:20788 length:120 start_codon:yes stop_codon:yes gene_type:complete
MVYVDDDSGQQYERHFDAFILKEPKGYQNRNQKMYAVME